MSFIDYLIQKMAEEPGEIFLPCTVALECDKFEQAGYKLIQLALLNSAYSRDGGLCFRIFTLRFILL